MGPGVHGASIAIPGEREVDPGVQGASIAIPGEREVNPGVRGASIAVPGERGRSVAVLGVGDIDIDPGVPVRGVCSFPDSDKSVIDSGGCGSAKEYILASNSNSSTFFHSGFLNFNPLIIFGSDRW